MQRKLLMSHSHICPGSVFWHTVLGRTRGWLHWACLCRSCTDVCVGLSALSVWALHLSAYKEQSSFLPSPQEVEQFGSFSDLSSQTQWMLFLVLWQGMGQGGELFAHRCANRMLYAQNLSLRSAKEQLETETWLWLVPFLSLLLDLFLKHWCSCSGSAWSNVSPAGSWGCLLFPGQGAYSHITPVLLWQKELA